MNTSSTVLCVRITPEIREKLDRLAVAARRSKSFLAAEAIEAYVAAEEWQLAEIATGIAELDAGKRVAHEGVEKWLRSWGRTGGKAAEQKPPQ